MQKRQVGRVVERTKKLGKQKREDRRTAHRIITLKQDHAAALVSGSQVIACMVEFDGRDDVGCM